MLLTDKLAASTSPNIKPPDPSVTLTPAQVPLLAPTNDTAPTKLLPALVRLDTWLVPVSAVNVDIPATLSAVSAACTTPPLAPAPRVVLNK